MGADLTLEKTLELARSIESAVRESKVLENSVSANVNRVIVHSKQQPKERACYRCGSKFHLANDPQCKAIKSRCSKCSKIGHFQKFCQIAAQRKYSGSNYGASGGTSSNYRAGHRVHHVNTFSYDPRHTREDDDPGGGDDIQVLATSSSHEKSKPVYCTVRVNHVPIRMMVDTGSAVTLISKTTYNKYFVDEALDDLSEDDRLSSYTDHDIDVLGCLKASVMYKNNVGITNVYIAKKGINILGRDLVGMLELNVYGKTMTCNSVSDNANSDAVVNLPVNTISNIELPEVVQSYSHMFNTSDNEELNCAKGFVHKVKVNDKIAPVQQKLRRLPFSVRDKVTEELKRLEHLGVIEKIDASEWVSPIVVTWKKSGSVRLCVDLRRVNMAVIPDKYPLPNIEEMFSELRNAKYFSQLDLASAYHQLLLHPDSRSLTAFITLEGLYQYRRVCFGISSAPSAF
jgi:hypothetical protein